MDAITSGTRELTKSRVFVSKVLRLKGKEGHEVVDWTTDAGLLAKTGKRAFIEIVDSVVAELGGLADPKHVYNVGLVHHDRLNTTVPTSVESVTSHEGSVKLSLSAAIANTRGTVGFDSGVSQLIEPKPNQAANPRLVVYFHSTGTDSTSSLGLTVKFHVEVSGDKTPDFE